MKPMYKFLALAACGLLGILALTAAERSSDAVPVKKEPVPAARDNPAGEGPAPLLLDASLRVADRSSGSGDQASERKELVIPKPGMMHVALDVLVNGRPLPTVNHAGKTYLPVPELGIEYQIRVWNHGPRRVVAIVSVDGLSVINGQPASEDHPGYIVAPYSHVVIKGWRRSLEQVAAFRFVDRDDSYASLTGKPHNIGVIGLVAFEERVLHPLPQLERKDAGPAAKGARTEVGSIGTEFGRDLDSRAYYVPFLRSGNKQAITLYYDTSAAPRALGVRLDPPLPVPFPGDFKFTPPPPGRRER